MAYKVKKQYINSFAGGIKKALKDLTQNEILSLSEKTRNTYFVEEKPKKKKKDDRAES
jgi:hypothetical protein